ncbi:MAG: LysM peptidoglycan-binding domain-containing protein [Acidobacteriota bacterium]|nr:LysM peptidoglycan-binding domain-containing protein [Acidobacteriota bacterium]
MFRFLCLLLSLPSGLFLGSFQLEQISDQFPLEGLEEKLEFWKAIFTHYGEGEVVFHDQNDLQLIYDVAQVGKSVPNDNVASERQKRELETRERELQTIMDDIRKWGSTSNRLTEEHKRIIRILKSHGYTPTSAELERLIRNIHSQRGIKEKFRESLIRSGKYLDSIEKILEQHNVPKELALLPHVESSFDHGAYSKRGAAGIWQFIRSTGRQYMTINSYVDERLDPLKATEAAARLLQQNYKTLGSWPLAITAFNHGRNGMARAKRLYGNDLEMIINHYTSPTFGYASKNFYIEFLAAVDVARNYNDYFGHLNIAEPIQFDSLVLDRSHHLIHITSIPDLSEEIIQEYNPQIRQPIWQKSKILPRGLTLRLPKGMRETVQMALDSATTLSTQTFVTANGSVAYRVQYGDTLSYIAKNLGTSIRLLQQDNNISNANRIYPDQLLYVTGTTDNPSRPDQYQVRRGDTLERIATRFGISIWQLQQANHIKNPHRILRGQVLLIPDS